MQSGEREDTSGQQAISRREQGLRFVRRMYLPRAIGLALGGVAIAGVLIANGAPGETWAALFFSTIVWPHIALWVGSRSRNPFRTELASLMVDSALGGAWIALMQFNLLPCVVLAVMLSIDKVHVGGLRLLARTVAWMAAACALTLLLCSLGFKPETSTLNILATLPLLIAYPLAISGASHALLRRTHDLNRRLEKLNRIDASTGLLNRTHWAHDVAYELRRFERAHQTATLMMIDIDEFKRTNDNYGHTVGDEVIRAVAGTIHDCTRDIDISGRYGGDEFGVVLVNTSSACARLVAERIRARVAALRLENHPMLRCSVSIGMAEVEREMHDVRAWIKHADVALYRAKARGRNRVAAMSPTDGILEFSAATKAQCA
jgi:diguanylate cyclase